MNLLLSPEVQDSISIQDIVYMWMVLPGVVHFGTAVKPYPYTIHKFLRLVIEKESTNSESLQTNMAMNATAAPM